MIGSANQLKTNKIGVQNTNDLVKIEPNGGTHLTSETNANTSAVAPITAFGLYNLLKILSV